MKTILEIITENLEYRPISPRDLWILEQSMMAQLYFIYSGHFWVNLIYFLSFIT